MKTHDDPMCFHCRMLASMTQAQVSAGTGLVIDAVMQALADFMVENTIDTSKLNLIDFMPRVFQEKLQGAVVTDAYLELSRGTLQ